MERFRTEFRILEIFKPTATLHSTPLQLVTHDHRLELSALAGPLFVYGESGSAQTSVANDRYPWRGAALEITLFGAALKVHFYQL